MGVHKTEAYHQIKHLLEIPEGEPIFILRAQDELARGVIEDYGVAAEAADCSAEFIDDVFKCADAFGEWSATHADKMKYPD